MSDWLAVNWRTLTVQLVTSFVVLVLLTAVAIGIPAIWLIQSQTENQAWVQVEQGRRATQSLLAAKQKEIDGLALLTAQRPSLPILISQGDKVKLEAFLAALQEGTALDLLLVCDTAGEQIALIGDQSVGSLCGDVHANGYYIAPEEAANHLWLLAVEPILNQNQSVGSVIVGAALNDSFAQQMKDQTGLEHIFFVSDDVISSSFTPATDIFPLAVIVQEDEGMLPQTKFTLNDHPYYAARLDLGPAGLVDEVALEVTNITQTQQRLVESVIGSIILVALAGSLVGIGLARGLGRPLRQLTHAATALSGQGLETAVTVNTQVQEVTMVAQALESARGDIIKSWGLA